MCERWEKFENFLADMGRKPTRRHSLDRIDPNGPYSPENCRWATMREQQNNRTNNRLIAAFGLSLTSPEWERRTGIKRATIDLRLKLGWTPEQAVTVRPKLGNRIKKLSDHY
jgi:hypothetical protein